MPADPDDVLAWQPIVLGKNAVCSRCNGCCRGARCGDRCRGARRRSRDRLCNPASRSFANDRRDTDLRTALEQLLRPCAKRPCRPRGSSNTRHAPRCDVARSRARQRRDRAQRAGARRCGEAIRRPRWRATPRVMRIAQIAAALFARQRWLGSPKPRGPAARAARRRSSRSREAHRGAMRAELRGGIAKLGQLASCRPDLVGPIWATELATLQDEVPPVDAAAIRARIEAELGKPIGEVFAEFDDVPIAAASLAQVHAATLLRWHARRRQGAGARHRGRDRRRHRRAADDREHGRRAARRRSADARPPSSRARWRSSSITRPKPMRCGRTAAAHPCRGRSPSRRPSAC